MNGELSWVKERMLPGGGGSNWEHTQAVCSTKSGDSQNECTEDHEMGMERETGNHTVLRHQGSLVGSE